MTDLQNWKSIRLLGKQCWELADLALPGTPPLKVELLNGPNSGVTVIGASSTLYHQLLNRGGEIKDVLMQEYPERFQYPKVRITVNPAMPAFAVPPGQQDPPAPPTIIPKLPPTTPPTANDYIFFV